MSSEQWKSKVSENLMYKTQVQLILEHCFKSNIVDTVYMYELFSYMQCKIQLSK